MDIHVGPKYVSLNLNIQFTIKLPDKTSNPALITSTIWPEISTRAIATR